jgi:hypothetical protein
LGFDDYADAFATIIEHSTPRFAMGIFGQWGSGKTTLMHAIERRLNQSEGEIVTVWFNAWRYEREEHLVIPLLEVLHEALAAWAEAQPDSEGAEAQEGRKLANVFKKASLALLSGLSFKAAPFNVGITLDGNRIASALEKEAEEAPEAPASLYHAAFVAMEKAVKRFAATNGRIVVFVDDLDRCLPNSALQVIESMKLLFDVEGFVFVVGLDESVIQRTIQAKYETSDGTRESPINASEYVKKIFQVPFGLPRVQTSQIDELFGNLVTTNGLSGDQAGDLNAFVRPHLDSLSDDGTLNPREVKRLVNAYTLQMKLLSSKLGPGLDGNVVMALQTMSFRSDWRTLYDEFIAAADEFKVALQEGLLPGEDAARTWVDGDEILIPPSFTAYLRGPGRALLSCPDLGVYVTSAEYTRSSHPGIREAQQAIRKLRRAMLRLVDNQLDTVAATDAQGQTDLLGGLLERLPSGPLLGDAQAAMNRLQVAVKAAPTDVDRANAAIGDIDRVLTELRRQTGFGAVDAA